MSALDAQARLIQGLAPVLDAPVSGKVPEDLPKAAVVISGARAGSSDGVTNVSFQKVECYDPDRDAAEALTQKVRTAVLAQAGHSLPDGTGLIDTVKVDSEPVEMFHSDEVTMFSATYRVASRDQK